MSSAAVLPSPPSCLTCLHLYGEAFEHWCTHPWAVTIEWDFVYGQDRIQRSSCRDMRTQPAACGPSGQWWSPRVVPVRSVWDRLRARWRALWR